ncbi:hypothetical protein [Poriferisphaera sp. WC338]|uniref:hypothetical protein n=1 Tax=Poriferisphaera sp. WC338 TaxID=3425129 RepID=UPI003D813497
MGSTRINVLAISLLAIGVVQSSTVYGVNRPASPPVSSSTAHVTAYTYNAAGITETITDPSGIQTKHEYDALGRMLKQIENYQDSVPGDSTSGDDDRTTAYTYTSGNQIKTITADMPDGTTDQTTTYVYSGELASPQDHLYVFNNDALCSIIYPDSDDALISGALDDGSDGEYDRVELEYNVYGKIRYRKDQQGTKLETTYSPNKRTVESIYLDQNPENIGGIGLLLYAYKSPGPYAQLDTITQYDTQFSIIGVLKYDYDGFGRINKVYQAHGGPINTSTSPAITYEYDDTLVGQEYVNGARLKKIIYPNGREINYLYSEEGDIDGINHDIGRITAIASASTRGTNDSNVIAAYNYLGDGMMVAKNLPTPNIKLDYTGDDPETTSVTENLQGFDSFGRIRRQRWARYDPNNGNQITNNAFDIRHGYDLASNRTHAERVEYPRASQHYQYDNLHRLKSYEAGTFNGTTANPSISDIAYTDYSDWKLDQLGNHLEVKRLDAYNNKGDVVYKNTVNNANEYESHKVKAGTSQRYHFSTFDSSYANRWELVDPNDQMVIDQGNLNYLEITSISGSEAIVLGNMPDTGPSSTGGYVNFPVGTVDGTQAGIVYGYKSENDYWLYVYEYNAAQSYSRHYHVVNGIKQLVASFNNSITLGSDKFIYTRARSQSVTWTVPFALGYPSGRVGYYTTHAGTTFRSLMQLDSFYSEDFLGRWSNYGMIPLAQPNNSTRNTVRMTWAYGWLTYPLLAKGMHLEDFEATFSLERNSSDQSSYNRGMQFVMDAKDVFDFQALGIRHELAADKTDAWTFYTRKVSNGGTEQASLGTYTSANYPDLLDTDKLWVRVSRVNGQIEVRATKSDAAIQYNSTIDSALDAAPICFQANLASNGGGQIGWLSRDASAYADDLLIRTDSDGNGSFETVEHFDDFEVGMDGYADNTMEYDPAGNMTFDGVYTYTYDAWNRMISVKKAYRDSNGVVQAGSNIITMQYDALGRRIVKKIENSGDLNAEYHYYYDGQKLIEARNEQDVPVQQYVWGTQYIDELIEIRSNHNPTTNTDFTIVEEEHYPYTYYALHNANFNVVGLIDHEGDLVERYEYTPYGERQVFVSAGPNDPKAMTPVFRSERIKEIEGEEDLEDPASLTGVVLPYSRNPIGHQGLFHDEEINLIYNRARIHNPADSNFIMRDSGVK